ncbi:hypothetical protein [Streptomyces sp. S.PB5]|uniref:hypothetical protein n=1 Tax=Streptomyces sp. S.PB5 TaxID=3020844 RepID=UPI0025B069F8|nr:hypothetical protein [Streptomyces sp. S.PB5]MDN3026968.1 hypothetical protein [Streptomyces sp. S.PB5]
MNRFRREGGWRSRAGRRQVSSNTTTGDNSNVQSVTAGRDASRISQSVTQSSGGDRAMAEVRASLREFRDALYRLDAGEDRDAGLRAVDRIERALGDPDGGRDTIESAADTIGVMGRTVAALAGAATAVQQAVAALF